MRRAVDSKRENLKSLANERIEEIISQLKQFFNNSTQSVEILITIFEQFYPSSSSSIYQSIIDLYSTYINKPSVNNLLDKTVEYLQVNSYHFDGQIPNCDLLQKAVIKKNENIFKFLLKGGVNPNEFTPDHKTPLAIVVVKNDIHPSKRLEYIQILLKYGANPIPRDIYQVSPFERLCGMGR